MKRPFAVIGFTAIALLSLLFLAESLTGAYCLLFILAALGLASLLKKNLRQAMTVPVCLFAGAAACLFFINHSQQTSLAQSFVGENIQVEAVVAESPWVKRSNGRHYCVLELDTLNEKKVSGRLRLSFSPSKDGIDENGLEIGNRISFTATLYIPGEDDKRVSRYFAGENIFLGAYGAEKTTITEGKTKAVQRFFHKLRRAVSDKLRYAFGDETAGLIIGILTGDKSCLDDSLYDSFKKTGVAHLMAVSGLHISLWVFFLGSLIPENKRSSRLKYLLLILAVVFIMLLAGMSESVKRAGFMSLVYLAGKLSEKRSDSINSLGLAVTLMVFYNPACVLSLSMQLSFLSSLGILTLGQRLLILSAELFGGEKINTPVRRLLRYAADSFFISISVLVFTFPVLIYAFGGFSAVGAYVNVLISPVVMPLLLLSALYVVCVVKLIALPVALLIMLLSRYIISVTLFFSSFENAFLVFEAENLLLYLAGAVIIVWLCILALKKNWRSFTAAALCVTLSAGLIIADNIYRKDALKIRLGLYGDCVIACVQRDRHAVLLSKAYEYEKSLFISSLEKDDVGLYGEIESYGEAFLKSADNGRYLGYGRELTLFEALTFRNGYNEQLLSFSGKDIHIFYSEALQCDCGCDIIIKITDNDAKVSVGEKSFSLSKEGSITLTLTENKTVLRGKSKWLNLMKSS